MAAPATALAAPEPLAREDLEILRLESPAIAGHTLKIAILDPPLDAPRPDVEALRARVAERIAGAPRLRRRVELRGGRSAAWVDDPGFDVRDHVRALPVSSPVSDDELRRVCARMMEERLDRSRPLWAIDVLDPLEGGGVAVVWKLHHSLADGAMAMRLADELLWDSPAERPAAAPPAPRRPLAGLRQALVARRPERLPGALRRELARCRDPSPFDGEIGAARVVAFASVPLGALRRAAKALVTGATVNDAVLALVGGGLRRWEEGRGGPRGNLRVRVPVSLHHLSAGAGAANRDSFFGVALPLAEADPVERLRRIHVATSLRKRAGDPVVLDTLLRDLARVSPPLARLLERLTLNPRAFALNVSNVVGPAQRPSLLGAPVRAFYSVAEINRRQALRVAVLSMADELYFGLCADAGIVGDLDGLVVGIQAEAAALSAASAGSGLSPDRVP